MHAHACAPLPPSTPPATAANRRRWTALTAVDGIVRDNCFNNTLTVARQLASAGFDKAVPLYAAAHWAGADPAIGAHRAAHLLLPCRLPRSRQRSRLGACLIALYAAPQQTPAY